MRKANLLTRKTRENGRREERLGKNEEPEVGGDFPRGGEEEALRREERKGSKKRVREGGKGDIVNWGKKKVWKTGSKKNLEGKGKVFHQKNPREKGKGAGGCRPRGKLGAPDLIQPRVTGKSVCFALGQMRRNAGGKKKKIMSRGKEELTGKRKRGNDIIKIRSFTGETVILERKKNSGLFEQNLNLGGLVGPNGKESAQKKDD